MVLQAQVVEDGDVHCSDTFVPFPVQNTFFHIAFLQDIHASFRSRTDRCWWTVVECSLLEMDCRTVPLLDHVVVQPLFHGDERVLCDFVVAHLSRRVGCVDGQNHGSMDATHIDSCLDTVIWSGRVVCWNSVQVLVRSVAPFHYGRIGRGTRLVVVPSAVNSERIAEDSYALSVVSKLPVTVFGVISLDLDDQIAMVPWSVLSQLQVAHNDYVCFYRLSMFH